MTYMSDLASLLPTRADLNILAVFVCLLSCRTQLPNLDRICLNGWLILQLIDRGRFNIPDLFLSLLGCFGGCDNLALCDLGRSPVMLLGLIVSDLMTSKSRKQ